MRGENGGLRFDNGYLHNVHRADEDQIEGIQETVSRQVDIIVGLRLTFVELGGEEQDVEHVNEQGEDEEDLDEDDLDEE